MQTLTEGLARARDRARALAALRARDWATGIELDEGLEAEVLAQLTRRND